MDCFVKVPEVSGRLVVMYNLPRTDSVRSSEVQVTGASFMADRDLASSVFYKPVRYFVLPSQAVIAYSVGGGLSSHGITPS